MIYAQECIDKESLLSYFGKIIADFPKYKDCQYRNERAIKLSKFAKFIIAKRNNEIIGMIAFYMDDNKSCFITHVSVLDKYRSNGVFSEMYKFLEQMIIKNACQIIRLEVRKSNQIALRSYYKQGFLPEDMSDGETIFMRKLL